MPIPRGMSGYFCVVEPFAQCIAQGVRMPVIPGRATPFPATGKHQPQRLTHEVEKGIPEQ